MKSIKIEGGHFTDIYRLQGKEDRKERYINYNNLLFQNLDTLINGDKQIIIINEVGTGAVVYGSFKYANRCTDLLRRNNPNKEIKVIDKKTSNGGNFVKLSLSIEDKKNAYKI